MTRLAPLVITCYFIITVALETAGVLASVNNGTTLAMVIYSFISLVNLIAGPILLALLRSDTFVNRSSKMEIYCAGSVSFIISIGIHMFTVSMIIASQFGSHYDLITILSYTSTMMGIVTNLCNIVWIYIAIINGHFGRYDSNHV